MDRRTGWLRSARSLTDALSVLYLQVVAQDTGSPALSRTATVTVILRDLSGREVQLSPTFVPYGGPKLQKWSCLA